MFGNIVFQKCSPVACFVFLAFVSSTTAGEVLLTARDASEPTWIFFADKNPSMAQGYQQAIASLEASYSLKAIQRRQMRGTGGSLFDFSDLPVAQEYVQGVLSTGATQRVSSPWLNAISVEASAGQLAAIRALPFVADTRPVARFSAPQSVAASTAITAADTSPSSGGFYGFAESQLNQIRIPEVHALGYTGSDVVIGVLDTGFKTTHAAYNESNHSLQFTARNFVNWGSTDSSPDHGTQTLGIIGAYKPNSYVGGAYDASFLLARTEDTSQEVRAEEDNWIAGLQWCEQYGADVVSSSLGYIDWYTQAQLDGRTAVTSIAAELASQRGLVIVNSAGNEGHDSNPLTSHLIAPADAASVLTVGAVYSNGAIAGFSSDGPSADGRVKPELLALGVGNPLLSAAEDTSYTSGSGTSFAAPLVTAAVALIIDAHPDWTVNHIRNALIQTASGQGVYDPLYVRGYGIIDAYAAIQYQAVPEPASAITMAAGLVSLLLISRRRILVCSQTVGDWLRTKPL